MDLVVEEEVEEPLTTIINLGELPLVEEVVEDAEYHLVVVVAVVLVDLEDLEDQVLIASVKLVKVAVVVIMEEKQLVVAVVKVVHPVIHQMQVAMVLGEKDQVQVEGQQVQMVLQ